MRLATLLFLIAATASAGIVDDLDDVAKWTAAPSDGVSLNLVPDHGSMRMDFDFRGHGGWAAARRSVDLALPDNYRFAFRLRGETPPNTLEDQVHRSVGRERLVGAAGGVGVSARLD